MRGMRHKLDGIAPPFSILPARRRRSKEKGALSALRRAFFLISIFAVLFSTPALAQNAAVQNIRGQIIGVQDSSISLKTRDGKSLRLKIPEQISIYRLSKAVFSDVNFGTYVGSVAVPLPDGWTYRALELRVLDEELRGLAIGHMNWDLSPESTMTHGWVDDLEVRILSIKYGPTDEEEKDVDVPYDVPITKMSLGDRSLLAQDVEVFAGAQKDGSGNSTALFILVGTESVLPPL